MCISCSDRKGAVKIRFSTSGAKFYFVWMLDSHQVGDSRHYRRYVVNGDVMVGVRRGEGLRGWLVPAVTTALPHVAEHRADTSPLTMSNFLRRCGEAFRQKTLTALILHRNYPANLRSCADLQALAPAYMYVTSNDIGCDGYGILEHQMVVQKKYGPEYMFEEISDLSCDFPDIRRSKDARAAAWNRTTVQQYYDDVLSGRR